MPIDDEPDRFNLRHDGPRARPMVGAPGTRRSRAATQRAAHDWRADNPSAYCYLLGAYLGDGNIIHKAPRTWTLRISCDRAYPAIEAEVRSAMEACFPGSASRLRRHVNSQADVASITHPAVGKAFPQHGRGRKHLRPIVLTPWQQALTADNPAPLIRGLIHSDGCRVINRFTTRLPSGRTAEYAYVRYFFSNLSADIREIFRDHCEALGIRVTQPNHRNLAVSHRGSVAIMERIVGPKS